MMQPSFMNSMQGPPQGQPMNSLEHLGNTVLQGAQGDIKRGPVEFNHAICYVNKIKVRIAIGLISSIRTSELTWRLYRTF